MDGQQKSGEALLAERKKRIYDTVALREPDRVPSMLHSTFWAATQAGMTCEQAMHDYKGLSDAMRKAILDLQPDAYVPCHLMLSLAPTMEILDYKQLEWPGHGDLSPDVTFQYIDREYMKADEYDDFITDPTGFYLRQYLPRLAGELEPLANLPEFPSIYFTRVMHALAFMADPEIRKALETMIKAGEEMQKMLGEAFSFIAEMEELGYPLANVASGHAPFDVVSDYLRGSKGGMLDMFRHEERVLKTLDILTEYIPRTMMKTASRLPGKIVFIPLHWGLDGFMSPDQFDKFFWPSLRQVIVVLIENDLIPCVLWEGDCETRLETIADVPAGKCIYWFERTDVFKAKEVLGDTVCIRGAVPASMLNTATPDDVKEFCKKLIDVVGKGGGFIMDCGIGVPDEAKYENVKMMFDFTREYGVYS
ncbi:MAG: uroporphyrinogen decarboxylase family protein [Rhodospirillales bacterium]|nr:uroporphyrinogen decarboxylase family protein [Rhodospirillales bacterium]|tara:strand:+ start:74 stop:1336 length:1263 start_codon:yes stop_codon:yes gene_type:complete